MYINIDTVRNTVFYVHFNQSYYTSSGDRTIIFSMDLARSTAVDQTLKDKHTKHAQDKLATRSERDQDSGAAIVCFGLENVLTFPWANISSFFYRSKISVYNLTAHCSLNKIAYCAIWSEHIAGRAANNIASALMAILYKISTEFQTQKCIFCGRRLCPSESQFCDVSCNKPIHEISQKYWSDRTKIWCTRTVLQSKR